MSLLENILEAVGKEEFDVLDAVKIGAAAASLAARAMKVALAQGMTEAEWKASVDKACARLDVWKSSTDVDEDDALKNG